MGCRIPRCPLLGGLIHSVSMNTLHFLPFCGLRYRFEILPDPELVLSPPYDVISPEKQAALMAASPNNMVNLDFGPKHTTDTDTDNRYTRAAAVMKKWLAEQVLVQDEVPGYYVYGHTYPTVDGTIKTLIGVIGMVKLHPFEDAVVLPHEKTLPGPITDRLELMKATTSSLSQVFTLFDDPQNVVEGLVASIMETPALLDTAYGDDRVRMWRLTDAAAVAQIQAFMTDRKLLIADGHHRYTTALHYRDYCRDKGSVENAESEYGLIFAANLHSEGLTIYPTHRVCVDLAGFDEASFTSKLETYFDVTPVATYADILTALPTVMPRVGLGVVLPSGAYAVLALREDVDLSAFWPADTHPVLKVLDVFVLQQIILIGVLGLSLDDIAQQRHLRYIKETPKVDTMVAAGEATVGFVMNPTRLTQMRDLCYAGVRMPQKSTFFYPKLVTGTVFAQVRPDLSF
jgi:uncharacterized protein (DUF1015 family)